MTQAQALSIMKTGVNVYLTGSAGSGKTYLLNQYINYLREHSIPVAITASTGIAATHMNGMTIHGWAGIGIKEFLSPYDLEMLEEKSYLWDRFDKARVLIIDEVSMLHAHRLDMVDAVCRKFKRNDKPFGGLQVILCGDFFQLPPINKSGNAETKDMVMQSAAWTAMNPAVCYLTEQHRQDDQVFTDLLNAIRDNELDDAHYDTIASRMNASLSLNMKPTKLYTHNKNVDEENNAELAELEEKEKIFHMTSTGKDTIVEILKKSCLAHEELRLKIGAEVMFIKNNFEEGYANGTRGKVVGFTEYGLPSVRLLNGKVINVSTGSWAIEENGKAKASVEQIPLRLAWAITIHKSQGMSLDSAEIDLSNAFSYGMGYVALSRVRTLGGIRLVGFKPEALRVDPNVILFDKKLREESNHNIELFGKLAADEQEKLEHEFINKMGGTIRISKTINKKTKKVEKIPTIFQTKELLDEGKSIKEIMKIRKYVFSTIINHIEQIVEKYPETIITHIRPDNGEIELVKAANKKLHNDEKGKLTSLKYALEKQGHHMSFEDIRLARLFL